MKTILSTRPIYHKCDETIREHVFCSFLSLLLIKELQERMNKKGWEVNWSELLNDIEWLKETWLQMGNRNAFISGELKGATGKVFQSAGVPVPQKGKIVVKDGTNN